jgi:macrolide phosphotransferase
MVEPPFPDDLDSLAATFERQFRDLGPVRPLRVLGAGFRSLALETPGGVVLRVGRSPDAANDYAKEWRIGKFLVKRLGTIVPEPRWYAEASADLPYGALGYRKLSGETPAWGVDPGAAFARDLGGFMARLHKLPVPEALAAGVPEVDSYRRMLSAREVITPVLAGRLKAGAFARVEAWWNAFAGDNLMVTPRLVVCHHDLWHDNLVRSASGRLSGVLDIAHVEVGDPAHDFPAPRYFGDGFMAELVAAYRIAGGQLDASDEYRAQRFYEAREFGGLAWAIEHSDSREIDAAVDKIIRGPIVAAG